MKIVIAMDSYKGSISSKLANETVRNAIIELDGSTKTKTFLLADGGEGTLDTLTSALNGQTILVDVLDPLMRRIVSKYGYVKSRNLAIIEMAQAAGLTLLEPHLQNPMVTSTYGVGQLILNALDLGCTNFIIGLGGSATSDCGIGMLQALGYRFFDAKQKLINGVGFEHQNLVMIDDRVVDSRLKYCKFEIACDVDNPLYGPNGAAFIYGPQKGASPHMIQKIDDIAKHFSKCVTSYNQTSHAHLCGSGAAGGLGFTFVSFFNANLTSGIDIIIDALDIESAIMDADLVITGEGKLDNQTINGKGPIGIARIAKKHNKPVIAFAGMIGENANVCNEYGIDAYFPIVQKPMSLSSAMDSTIACKNLNSTVQQVYKLLQMKGNI